MIHYLLVDGVVQYGVHNESLANFIPSKLFFDCGTNKEDGARMLALGY